MRTLLLYLLSLSLLFSINWTTTSEFTLKKDRVALWLVGERELSFRWTLFHNEGLVYIAKFDNFPYQGILYDDYRKNGFKIKLSVNTKANTEDPCSQYEVPGKWDH